MKRVCLVRHGPRKGKFLSLEGLIRSYDFKIPHSCLPIDVSAHSPLTRTKASESAILNGNKQEWVESVGALEGFGSLQKPITEWGWKIEQKFTLSHFKSLGTPAELDEFTQDAYNDLWKIFNLLSDGRNGLIVSHTPFIELVTEKIFGGEFGGELKELGYVVISEVDGILKVDETRLNPMNFD